MSLHVHVAWMWHMQSTIFFLIKCHGIAQNTKNIIDYRNTVNSKKNKKKHTHT